VDTHSDTPWWRTRSGLALCGFLLVAGFFLLTEHTAHVFGVLPYLLLLACPLMHVFMHHGHNGHGGHAGYREPGSPGATGGDSDHRRGGSS
jgi:hypothetical protein